MDATVIWLSVGLAVCIMELLTGTFYLLAIGIALMMTSISSYFEATGSAQLFVASVLVFLNIYIVHWLKKRLFNNRGSVDAINGNNLDVGETVAIQEWHTDGSATVNYRGTEWQAVRSESSMPESQIGTIVAISGNRLIISTKKEQNYV